MIRLPNHPTKNSKPCTSPECYQMVSQCRILPTPSRRVALMPMKTRLTLFWSRLNDKNAFLQSPSSLLQAYLRSINTRTDRRKKLITRPQKLTARKQNPASSDKYFSIHATGGEGNWDQMRFPLINVFWISDSIPSLKLLPPIPHPTSPAIGQTGGFCARVCSWIWSMIIHVRACVFAWSAPVRV